MKNMRLSKKNIWLISIHVLAIVLIVYTGLIVQMFATPESVDYHLKESGSYIHITEIVKDEISERLPPEISDKILRLALAQNLLNYFVTPATVQRIAQPLLKAGSTVVNQPTSIEDNKVVVDTKTYKERISQELTEMQIPESLQEVSAKLVASIPETITLVDMEKRPNSVLGLLVRGKEMYSKISFVNGVLIAVAGITFLMLIILNLRSIKQFLLSLSYGYFGAGVFVTLGSWALPYIFNNFLPNKPHPIIGEELNLLVDDLVTYFFELTRKFGWVYLLIFLIAFLLWRLSFINRVQTSVDHLLDKTGKKNPSKKKPH